MENPAKSAFSFKYFAIQESHFVRKPGDLGEITYKITPSGIFNKAEGLFQLNIEFLLSDENDNCLIQLIAIAIFEFKEKIKEEEIDNFFFINSPSIAFPYLRSFISTLTSASGFEAISLPLFNLSKLGEELKQNITVEAE
ncbi:preprotein translocase subunit SecB [Pontibacter mucosus]|uniref:Preprotein translocase subunit SecB n=1 Tax=Pontibacter mucosus TaxID=1649266 RepID=A0A2T5YQH4_9BACT|nr:protein-export chaperone SecB [Pontibacter mucosus]PTX21554.1 preprotein translocase subunit SecB [Pontibacter mucosus]